MNKTKFLHDPNVVDFIDWCIIQLPSLQINLNISRSRFVPKPINTSCQGLDEVLSHYAWKAVGTNNGSWNETVNHLGQMAAELRHAVDFGTDDEALAACKNVLNWGGNRNYKVGAYPFLCSQTNLRDYIQNTAHAFCLNTANTSELAGPHLPVRQMNSMLTKVHALYAQDGLPIYDSRVAAAIATLVEQWRRHSGLTTKPLPNTLKFPATLPTRTVLKQFTDADHPGVMIYGADNTVVQWSGAKVRLGWLIGTLIDRLPNLFADIDGGRMRAFEAALFMIGYDVRCLN